MAFLGGKLADPKGFEPSTSAFGGWRVASYFAKSVRRLRDHLQVRCHAGARIRGLPVHAPAALNARNARQAQRMTTRLLPSTAVDRGAKRSATKPRCAEGRAASTRDRAQRDGLCHAMRF